MTNIQRLSWRALRGIVHMTDRVEIQKKPHLYIELDSLKPRLVFSKPSTAHWGIEVRRGLILQLVGQRMNLESVQSKKKAQGNEETN